MSEVLSLERFPLHLGLGAKAIAQPEFSGMEWYQAYAARHEGDGAEGRLVAMHRFTGGWDSWEMHPVGAEVVVCIEGTIEIIQEHPDGCTTKAILGPSEYAINPPGVWHTADISGSATALFITAGLATEHRPR